jgi:hypothetical protein
VARELRSVAVPREHGGWGLTLEPGLLGLLLAGSGAGWFLTAAAMVAFVARTPLRVVAVDLRRRRWLHRTRLASAVGVVELTALAGLVASALARSEKPFWVPAAIAAPLILVEAWFDVRSQGRRLVPELSGAVGVCAVAAMIVLAGGGDTRLAAGAWLLLTARVTTSIPHVRAMIAGLHGRPTGSGLPWLADLLALSTAALAVWSDRRLLVGAVSVSALVLVQRASSHRPVRRAAIVGIQQMALGLAVVVAAALGVHAPWH